MNLCKKLLLAFFISIAANLSRAQPATTATAVPTATTTATQTTATANDDGAKKLEIAKELLQILELNKSIEQSFVGADRQLKRNVIGKDEKVATTQNKKLYTVAKTKFEKQKPDVTKDILEQLSKDFSNRFSEAELKYLIQLSKYPVYKKFTTFLESDAYYASISKPLTQVDKVIEESRKEVNSMSEKR